MDFFKTIINGLLCKIRAMRPDWGAKDGDDGFIKNKPFGEYTVPYVVYNGSASFQYIEDYNAGIFNFEITDSHISGLIDHAVFEIGGEEFVVDADTPADSSLGGRRIGDYVFLFESGDMYAQSLCGVARLGVSEGFDTDLKITYYIAETKQIDAKYLPDLPVSIRIQIAGSIKGGIAPDEIINTGITVGTQEYIPGTTDMNDGDIYLQYE